MKKLLSILLVAVLLITAMPLGSFEFKASAETEYYYTYEVENGKAIITDCDTSISGSVTIPSTLGGYPVTSIDYKAFEYCSSLTSITIPESVTSIGDSAFSSCSSLTSVTIPDNVTSIGYSAFYNCSSLEKVNITDLSAWCNIDFAEYDSNPLFYAENLYINGTLATDITIPNSVTSIGSGAFDGCSRLQRVDIGDGVIFIGEYAFANCDNLSDITLGNKITTIGDCAFDSCAALDDIILPESLITIGIDAFSHCTSLTSIVIPDNVTQIGRFCECSSLKSVILGRSVTEIDSWAFGSCSSLTSIVIPDSVTYIGQNAFEYCYNLQSVTIGDGVTEIPYLAFRTCYSLQNVELGKNITTIDERAFDSCSSLSYITLPESVEIIGKSAFDDCYSLSHVLFKGSQEQYNWILFHSNNDYIKNAKWHLNATDTEITNEKFCNTMYAYCSICQKYLTEDGTVYPHQFYDYISDNNATCSEDGTKTAKCIYCEATDTQIDEHSMLEHTYDNNCDTACNVCKQNRTIKHNYSAATCTKPKTCKVCGTTSGKALGHKYNNACDTSCNVCKATRKITHKYTKKTTVKATVSKNGYILTECSVCGKDKSKTIIYYPKTIKLSASTYAYNSKVIKPTVTVKDSKNKTISSKYYTVTYQSGRKNVGKYKVTIKFKGNYSGSKVLYFTINPPKTTVSKLVAGKKSATVYITKKSAQVTGYQIQYATNKNFKSAKTKTISSYKTTKYALKGLSAKKYYYVRVRTYKKVSGITYYSGWSTLKYVKTK